MIAFLILLLMLFLHCIADYSLQGVLVKMKQKSWWEKQVSNYSHSQYKNDHKAALWAHAFEWTFVVLLPCVLSFVYKGQGFGHFVLYLALLSSNTCFHYAIDDLKANEHFLNLCQDQIYHIVQIFVSWILWWSISGWF